MSNTKKGRWAIAAVARDTGLSKETLRIWERRYDFPRPERAPNGERLYGAEQVEKLRLMKRLMDAGLRPRALAGSSLPQLRRLGSERVASFAAPPEHASAIEEALAALRARDLPLLRGRLRVQLARLGLRGFVLRFAGAMTERVGVAWARGEIGVGQEHLYTEQMESLLRGASAQLAAEANGPRILMTTLPGEEHRLGLLMLEALLASELAACIPLGPQTSVAEIAAAASASRVQAVALSFSRAFPRRAALKGLAEMRARLPAGIALWAGGDGLRGARRRVPGVAMPMTLESALAELAALAARAA